MSTTTPAAQQRESEKRYEDVSPLSSDADSDFENDPIVRHARNSVEVADHDRRILDEEEEREKLLTEGRTREGPRSFFGRRRKDEQSGAIQTRQEQRISRRSRKTRRNTDAGTRDDQGELMYEMEEGGTRDDTSSQASSSSAELDKLNIAPSSIARRRRLALWIIIGIIITALFGLLTFGAYEVSDTTHFKAHLETKSNGTSTFGPTTILISLDGFRADFLHRGITPTLNQFVAEGVSPRYMLPSFPSVTFPNHYTLVTGLYPESHGVVGNSFWDPDLKEEFWYTDPARSMDPKWWAGGEPLWVTAEKQNLNTAIHMWPGSEAGMDFSATFLDKFNGSETLSKKTGRILELLDLPGRGGGSTKADERPQFIAAYVPVVDADGHTYGPNSTEIWNTISNVDVMLHNLFTGLEERNLTDIVNVVVVSDHGMATTSVDRCVQLDDLIDLDLVEHIDGWPLYGLRPKSPIDLRGLYDRLLIESQATDRFEVYLRDQNMPERYHFSKNDRIAPLWVVPKTGWAIVHKEDFDVKESKATGEEYRPKGLHGYDHEHSLMRAIFVARGPAFLHKPNSRLDVFQNTEVYNIVCDSLGIEPKPNNGTLRLPLKPVGLHSDLPEEPTPPDGPTPPDDPDDPNDSDEPTPPDEPTMPEKPSPPAKPSSPDNPNDALKDTGPGITSDQEATADELAAETEEQKEEAKEEMNEFWAYVKAKMKAAEEWANKVIASLKANHKGKEQQEQGNSFDQGSQS